MQIQIDYEFEKMRRYVVQMEKTLKRPKGVAAYKTVEPMIIGRKQIRVTVICPSCQQPYDFPLQYAEEIFKACVQQKIERIRRVQYRNLAKRLRVDRTLYEVFHRQWIMNLVSRKNMVDSIALLQNLSFSNKF